MPFLRLLENSIPNMFMDLCDPHRPSASGQSPARMRRVPGASQSQTEDQSDDDSSEAELKIDEGEDTRNVVRFSLVQRISSRYLFSSGGLFSSRAIGNQTVQGSIFIKPMERVSPCTVESKDSQAAILKQTILLCVDSGLTGSSGHSRSLSPEEEGKRMRGE